MSERVLVCGSRTWNDRATIFRALSPLAPGTVIIHGDASGADRLADQVARGLDLEVRPYPALWGVYGRSAGPIRNQQMLDTEKPTRVIAFRAYGPSPGTDDMLRRARQAGIDVTVWSPEVKL